MSDLRTKALWGGGVVAVLVVISLVARIFVLGPASELRGKIARAKETAQGFSSRIDGLESAQDRLLAVGETMLARDRDLLEHRLRAGLSDLATRSGLRDVVVTNTPPRAVENPAARVRMTGGYTALRQRLRSRADFYVVRGRVQGAGSLDAALTALASLESQAWVHRVEGVTIRPAGGDRSVVEFKADFAIVMAPDLAPREAPSQAPEIAPAGDQMLAGVGRLTSRGLFAAPPKAPEPVVVVKQPDPEPMPAPKPPPYENWRLAGVMGGNRVEAVVVHTSNGRSRLLGVGDRVLGATFEEGSGERAVFRIGQKRYEVLLGKSLADRRELK